MLERKVTVRDIMTSPVYIIFRPKDRVNRVIALLCTQRISGMLVIDGKGQPVGLISERDLYEGMYSRGREL